MNTEEEWEHSLIHRCIHVDDTEDFKLGDFIASGECAQLYVIIDIMDDRVKAIKHDGVIH